MKIINKIKNRINETSLLFFVTFVIKRVLSIILYYLFRLFPIKSKLIVFESERDYCDNSWALYHYISSHYSGYEFVWVTHEKKIYNNHKHTKFVYHPFAFTPLSAWYIARAKYIYYTHGLCTNFKKRKRQIVIILWHGIAL